MVWIEREERGIEIFGWEVKQVKPRIYIESGISLDRDVLRRCREQNLDRSRWCRQPNCFDGLRWCWASIEQTESLEIWLNGLGYLFRGMKKTQENFDRKGLCREVSSFYRASVVQTETRFFKEGKTHVMNAHKIDTKPTIKEAC